MNNDMQNALRKILSRGGNAAATFDRIIAEYQATGDAGKKELFLAVAAELATAQVAVAALRRRA